MEFYICELHGQYKPDSISNGCPKCFYKIDMHDCDNAQSISEEYFKSEILRTLQRIEKTLKEIQPWHTKK